MSIETKLNKLLETKNAIKEALISKGQLVNDTDTFYSYADKVAAIQGGGGIDFDSNTRVSYKVGLTIPSSDTSFNFNPLLMPELAIIVE